jgi:hypothetical protein
MAAECGSAGGVRTRRELGRELETCRCPPSPPTVLPWGAGAGPPAVSAPPSYGGSQNTHSEKRATRLKGIALSPSQVLSPPLSCCHPLLQVREALSLRLRFPADLEEGTRKKKKKSSRSSNARDGV